MSAKTPSLLLCFDSRRIGKFELKDILQKWPKTPHFTVLDLLLVDSCRFLEQLDAVITFLQFFLYIFISLETIEEESDAVSSKKKPFPFFTI